MRFAIRNASENTAKRTMIGNEIFGVSIGSASEVNQVAVSTEEDQCPIDYYVKETHET